MKYARSGSRFIRALVLVACVGLGVPSTPACNLGPFPDFLEQLDPLDPVRGDVKGWIVAQDSQTRVLVLSESGRFLHSVVNRDTSVRLEVGAFLIDGGDLVMRSELRYVFSTETGSVNDREGAQSEEVDAEEADAEERRAATIEDERLTIDGWGTFIGTEEYVAGLDLTSREGRGCLLKYIQLSIRTAQSRIRSLGSSGTVIYHNNKSTFSGFLSGEQSIVVENLLSPDTTIAYDGFSDFPEVRLDGFVLSHVDTSGDGTLDEAVRYRILGPAMALASDLGGASSESALSDSETGMEPVVLAEGSLSYGLGDPIRIEQADVVGGSYDFEMELPSASTDNFEWSFLADLDLRACFSTSSSNGE